MLAQAVRNVVLGRQRAVTHGAKAQRLAMNHETFSHNTRNPFKQVFAVLRQLLAPRFPRNRPMEFRNLRTRERRLRRRTRGDVTTAVMFLRTRRLTPKTAIDGSAPRTEWPTLSMLEPTMSVRCNAEIALQLLGQAMQDLAGPSNPTIQCGLP
jgi:hypothetical protein